MSNLTPKEAEILAAWPTNYSDAADEKADNATWSEVADLATATRLPVKTVRSILGSLAKKGLVEGGHEKANGEAGELQLLTDAWIEAAFAIRSATPKEPAEPIDAAPAKLTFTDVATGSLIESRRVPSAHHRANAERLVTVYGGSSFTEAQAAEIGIDAETLPLLVKRFRSWFGKASVVRTAEGWTLNLK